MINEARLRRVIKAFDVYFPTVDRYSHVAPDDMKVRVSWQATIDGWSLRPAWTNWEFSAPTMDGCTEQFATKIREVCAREIKTTRASYDKALAVHDAVEAALT